MVSVAIYPDALLITITNVQVSVMTRGVINEMQRVASRVLNCGGIERASENPGKLAHDVQIVGAS
jgi:hypothetical protein